MDRDQTTAARAVCFQIGEAQGFIYFSRVAGLLAEARRGERAAVDFISLVRVAGLGILRERSRGIAGVGGDEVRKVLKARMVAPGA